MKTYTCLYLLLATFAVGGRNLPACEPGGLSTKHGGFGDKGTGVSIPGPVAWSPAAPNPAMHASMAQQRQALAMQASAYLAARRPLKLAKAYEMRQATLAARESRRAWVLAKQEERERASRPQDLQPSHEASGPVYVAMRANTTRPLSP